MNQINPTDTYQGPAVPRGLTKEDARLLHSALVSGDAALARQADLIELHKRIVALFTTMSNGLGENQVKKADADRKILTARIDELEKSVNRMEGAVRIELEPVLRRTVTEALAVQAARPARSRLRGLMMIGLLIAGVGVGAVYSDRIVEAANWVQAAAFTKENSPSQILSPNGGITTSPDLID